MDKQDMHCLVVEKLEGRFVNESGVAFDRVSPVFRPFVGKVLENWLSTKLMHHLKLNDMEAVV
ncbi:MAG: hypothetical protein ABSB32_08885, partial [Thermodesulfobacteriota bacterium]